MKQMGRYSADPKPGENIRHARSFGGESKPFPIRCLYASQSSPTRARWGNRQKEPLAMIWLSRGIFLFRPRLEGFPWSENRSRYESTKPAKRALFVSLVMTQKVFHARIKKDFQISTSA
jgi:hypothetical protein